MDNHEKGYGANHSEKEAIDDSCKKKDYKVGYKRPPVEHQFKPGTPGNKNGRRKLVQDFVTDVKEESEEIMTIQEGGKIKKITKQRAFIKKVYANALNGNIACIKLVAALLSKLPIKPEDIEKELSVDDAKILEDYIKRRTNHDNQSF